MNTADSAIKGLVVFDLDGTLLRGDTVCEVLAAPIGKLQKMKIFEKYTAKEDIKAARQEMANWYKDYDPKFFLQYLESMTLAPGAIEAIKELKNSKIEVGIASITWKFAVEKFAKILGINHFLGTELLPNGQIIHIWGIDKALWLKKLRKYYGISTERTAAVGDSSGDLEMLNTAELSFYVGKPKIPGLSHALHFPEADLRDISKHIISTWVG